jgi:hypothetical protein
MEPVIPLRVNHCIVFRVKTIIVKFNLFNLFKFNRPMFQDIGIFLKDGKTTTNMTILGQFKTKVEGRAKR